MNDLIFNVLTAVIVAIVGIVAKQVIPYIKKKEEEAMAQLRKTRWEWAADLADAVVRAVEQTLAGELMGPQKKAKAMHMLYELLAEMDLPMTTEQASMLIEAAVQAMNEGMLVVDSVHDPSEMGAMEE